MGSNHHSSILDGHPHTHSATAQAQHPQSDLERNIQGAERRYQDAVRIGDQSAMMVEAEVCRFLNFLHEMNEHGIAEPAEVQKHVEHYNLSANAGASGVRIARAELYGDAEHAAEVRVKEAPRMKQYIDAMESIKFTVSPAELHFAAHARRMDRVRRAERRATRVRVRRTVRTIRPTSSRATSTAQPNAPPAAEVVPSDDAPELPALIPASRTSVDFAETAGSPPACIRAVPRHLAIPDPVQGEQRENHERPADIPPDSLLSTEERFMGRGARRALWNIALVEAFGAAAIGADDFEPPRGWGFEEWTKRQGRQITFGFGTGGR